MLALFRLGPLCEIHIQERFSWSRKLIYSLRLIGFFDPDYFPKFVRFGSSRFAVVEARNVLDL